MLLLLKKFNETRFCMEIKLPTYETFVICPNIRDSIRFKWENNYKNWTIYWNKMSYNRKLELNFTKNFSSTPHGPTLYCFQGNKIVIKAPHEPHSQWKARESKQCRIRPKRKYNTKSNRRRTRTHIFQIVFDVSGWHRRVASCMEK